MLIKKYTPEWINHFNDLKSEMNNALAGLNYSIEHIGSTSVPGLDSKNIIDMDIIYNVDADFEHIKAGLTQIGYYHNGNQGIEQREVFKRSDNLYNSILDTIAHHLYACPADSPELKRHLLFRNYLRKNETARFQYQSMKYELAEKAGQDKKRYATLKEASMKAFIESIIEEEKVHLDKLKK